ncbi:uncharacterized protein [Nicotiana tomentosiformis]|uniref:uncharacterized protein n=1 Tax=Nicotiana tomentosiformis TaxID=4098 RepID=UPI00388CC125
MAKETGSEISFQAAANVARRIEMVLTQERGQGSDKKPQQFGGFSGASSGGMGNFGRGHPPRPFHSALQASYSAPPAPISAPPIQCFQGGYSSRQGQFQDQQSQQSRSCYTFGDPRHISRFCPKSQGIMHQHGSRVMVPVPVASPPAQPTIDGEDAYYGVGWTATSTTSQGRDRPKSRERVFGATFDEVVDIIGQIEMVHSQEGVEREAKMPRGQCGFSSVPSGGSFTTPGGACSASEDCVTTIEGGETLCKVLQVCVLAQRWLELLKEYDITILYHPWKANVVADTLSRRAESLGSLSYVPAVENTLVLDVQALASQFVRLDISEPSRVLTCVFSRSSLYDRIRERQCENLHLLVLKDMVHHGDAKEVTIGDDAMCEISDA